MPVAADRFAYLAMIGVGKTDEEGGQRAHQILDYSRSTPCIAAQFWFPPGYTSNAVRGQALRNRGTLKIPLRDGTEADMRSASVDDFINAGIAFADNPDTVFEQIREFSEHVGGIGHLLMMEHISHQDMVANRTLFSREVLPRLRDL